MEAWEFAISTYMHETKIGNKRLRRGILGYPLAENFLYKQIPIWAEQGNTHEDYCFVLELESKNSCQEMMAYTLMKAIDDLESRLGPYTGNNWRQGDLFKVRYEHQFSETPMRSQFEEVRSHDGNGRTPQMHMWFYHQEGELYQAHSGQIFRMIQDMSDQEFALYAQDVEIDQSRLWNTKTFERSMTDIWNDNDYFRVPTFEGTNGP